MSEFFFDRGEGKMAYTFCTSQRQRLGTSQRGKEVRREEKVRQYES